MVVNPIEPSESDVAYKLVELGFTVNERPIYQVTLPQTEEHKANEAVFQTYMNQINELLKTTTERVLDPENEDSPATIFNTFTTEAAKIELSKY